MVRLGASGNCCVVSASFRAKGNTVSATTGFGGYVYPTSPQRIIEGETAQFTFFADSGYHIESITGCGVDFNNTDETLVNYNVTTDPILSNCIVSASFAINQGTVIADAGTNGSLDSSTPSPQVINNGDIAQFTFNANAGYHISTISGCGIDFSNTDYPVMSETVTTDPFSQSCSVVASFAVNQYTVSALAGSYGTLDLATTTPQIINYRGTTQFTFYAESLYHIESISGCGIDFSNLDNRIVSKNVLTDQIINDCMVFATFALSQNTVIAIAGNNGKLDVSTPSPQTVYGGETAQFTFNADAGYYLSSIIGCGIDYSNIDDAITSKTVATTAFTQSCAVNATFATNQHIVLATAGANGKLDPTTPSPQSINDGRTALFTFSADAGYHVSAISGCGVDFSNADNTLKSKTVTTDPIDGDCTISAIFGIDVNTVIAIAGENGELDVTTPSPQIVNDGETTQFTFNADAGYYVASISGCGIGFVNTDNAIVGKTATISAFTQSCIVNATFALKQNTVVALASANGELDPSTPSPQLVLNIGEVTEFTFNADTGYHVASISGCGISYTNTANQIASLTISTAPFTSSCSVYTEFAINQYIVTAFVSPMTYGTLNENTPTPQTVNYGETVQFSFNAEPGYHINYITSGGHWTPPCGAAYTNTNGDNTITDMTVLTDPIMNDCTVRGSFWLNQNTVTASAGENGTLDVTTPSPRSVSIGETVQFTFNADTDYHVASISGCGINYTNTDNTLTTKMITTDPSSVSCVVNATFDINIPQSNILQFLTPILTTIERNREKEK